MTKQRRLSNPSFVLLALVILLCVNWLWQNDNHVDQLEYSQVRQLFLQEKVTGLTIDSGGTLTLELREPVNGSETVRYELYSFQLFYDDFNDLVQQQYAEGIIQHYDYPEPVRTNWLLELLPFLLTAVILGLMWYFLVIRPQGGGMGPDKMAKFGSARTRMLTDKDKKVTFDDVAGADEEKEELREIVEFLKDPKKYLSLGARIPKGVLLVGPPGTGKTLLAARKNQKFITMQDLKDAEIKVIAGPEKKSRVIPQHERELTAYHEAGHAVVMHALPDQDPVTQITIVPRGQAGGMTISLPEEDRSYLSRRYMEDQIVGLLGGRVAEKLCLGDISTGASNDIQRASQIARKMVATYGMSDKIGTVAFESGHDEVFIGRTMTQGRSYSEAVAAQIDQEVQRLVADAYDRCERILNDNRDKLEAVASYLLEHETMEREAFLAVFGEQPLSLKKEEV